jgi:pimeloyl-ACP methyl ester carboxylesterase
VIFFEHKALYDMSGPVPEESYALPFGEANVVRDGEDVTIVTLGAMVHTSLLAAIGDAVPVTVVWGRQDQIIPAEQATAVAGAGPLRDRGRRSHAPHGTTRGGADRHRRHHRPRQLSEF